MTERFLTRTEVAQMVRLDVRTLGNLASAGSGPPYLRTGRVRGRTLYRERDVVAWLQDNARGQPATSSLASSTASSSPRPKSPRRRKAASKG